MSAQQTVLVVDDEEPLRRYMGRVIEDEGYRVLLAADGLEALALLKKTGHTVHLVITDIVMPVMTGPELAGRLAKQSAPPPVLFVSGGHTLPEVPGPILRKPFLPRDLHAAVRSVLGGGAEVTRPAAPIQSSCDKSAAPPGWCPPQPLACRSGIA